MKIDSSSSELASTGLSTLLLALPLGILSPLSSSSSKALLEGSGLSMLGSAASVAILMVLCTGALAFGLLRGLLRHQNISPLLFALLGLTSLSLGGFLMHSFPLTVIGSLCVLTAGFWNLLLPASRLTDEPAAPPDLEKFLERSA